MPGLRYPLWKVISWVEICAIAIFRFVRVFRLMMAGDCAIGRSSLFYMLFCHVSLWVSGGMFKGVIKII